MGNSKNMHVTKRHSVWGTDMENFGAVRVWRFCGDSSTATYSSTNRENLTKINFRSFIYCQSSTQPANLVKNGPVDVEIIGLTKISKHRKILNISKT